MTIDELGGPAVPFSQVAALFPGEAWLEVGEYLGGGHDAPLVRVIEGSLSVPALKAGEGPWALVVHGDLFADGDLDFWTSDYRTSLLVVRGNVRARNFRFTNGAMCFVSGSLDCSGVVVGRYGDESARLVASSIKARAVLLDHVTGIECDAIDALVDSADGWGLPRDFEEADPTEIFVGGNRSDLGAIWKSLHAGEDIFLPGAEARLNARRAGQRPAR